MNPEHTYHRVSQLIEKISHLPKYLAEREIRPLIETTVQPQRHPLLDVLLSMRRQAITSEIAGETRTLIFHEPWEEFLPPRKFTGVRRRRLP